MKNLIIPILILILSSGFYSCGKLKSSESEKLSREILEMEIKEKELAIKEKEIALMEKAKHEEELRLHKEELKKKRCSATEVEKFLERWATHQNNKNFNSYINFYSTDFSGIKRTISGKTSHYDYDGWVNDRRKMINNNEMIHVYVESPKVVNFDENTGITKIRFTQSFYTFDYEDEGTKEMLLTKDNAGNIIIKKEEMINSREVDHEGC